MDCFWFPEQFGNCYSRVITDIVTFATREASVVDTPPDDPALRIALWKKYECFDGVENVPQIQQFLFS